MLKVRIIPCLDVKDGRATVSPATAGERERARRTGAREWGVTKETRPC